MKLSAKTRAFEERLGHRFERPERLVEALTHGSISSPTRPDNQRLEFLGDRVLGLVIAEALFEAFPAAPEGELARRYNALVRKETCAEIAREVGLGEALRLGKSEQATGGRRKMALLGDALEAVIAAVYLDAGFSPARELVRRLWGGRITAAGRARRDAKTRLQEVVQAMGQPPPTYHELARSGPAHAPVFTVEARLEDGRTARGEAPSKRQAEQKAAAAMLAEMGESDD